MNFDEFSTIIKQRRSIRAFKDEPVEHETLLKLIDAARWAPSAHNYQPVEFIIVTEENGRRALAQASDQSTPLDAPACIVVIVDLEQAIRYGNAPDDAPNLERAILSHSQVDAAAAIQNILLAATALELGSLWMGGFEPAALRSPLCIPQNCIPIAIIALGWPDEAPDPPERRSVTDLIHLEQYQTSK